MTLPSVSKLLTTSTVLLAVATPGVSASPSSSSGRFAVIRQRTNNSHNNNDYWRERRENLLGATLALERTVRFRSAQNAFVTDQQQQQPQYPEDEWHHAETATTTANDDTIVGRFALEYEPERITIRSAENAHIRMKQPNNYETAVPSAHRIHRAKPAVSSFLKWNPINTNDNTIDTEDESRQQPNDSSYRLNDNVFV